MHCNELCLYIVLINMDLESAQRRKQILVHCQCACSIHWEYLSSRILTLIRWNFFNELCRSGMI